MAKFMIELTDEELDQINGGLAIVKDILYNDQIIKTTISPAGGKDVTAGKNDPGENPVFK
ncbi:MAG: bacteriocin [Solobacterium sp.]|nr:bacteriocin [Solobacterium sp.]